VDDYEPVIPPGAIQKSLETLNEEPQPLPLQPEPKSRLAEVVAAAIQSQQENRDIESTAEALQAIAASDAYGEKPLPMVKRIATRIQAKKYDLEYDGKEKHHAECAHQENVSPAGESSTYAPFSSHQFPKETDAAAPDETSPSLMAKADCLALAAHPKDIRDKARDLFNGGQKARRSSSESFATEAERHGWQRIGNQIASASK
jgi:hypothetical protein